MQAEKLDISKLKSKATEPTMFNVQKDVVHHRLFVQICLTDPS